jgi:hypothetical protein
MLFWMWIACSMAPDDLRTCDGAEVLFGAPSSSTGLDAADCAPSCTSCGFVPPEYGPADVAALRQWTLLDPPAAPMVDPYSLVEAPAQEEGVCAVVVEDPGLRTYRLQSFSSTESAEAADGAVTHGGSCGVCSSLDDLTVYMEQGDLTEPVRACGIEHVFSTEEEHVACLEDLGFTAPCAWIWMYNTRHTRAVCLEPCLELLEAPYHEPDGSPNACIQCDEDQSGPVFKAVAGRTRRNSGLPSALCRPCDTVFAVVHGELGASVR